MRQRGRRLRGSPSAAHPARRHTSGSRPRPCPHRTPRCWPASPPWPFLRSGSSGRRGSCPPSRRCISSGPYPSNPRPPALTCRNMSGTFRGCPLPRPCCRSGLSAPAACRQYPSTLPVRSPSGHEPAASTFAAGGLTYYPLPEASSGSIPLPGGFPGNNLLCPL